MVRGAVMFALVPIVWQVLRILLRRHPWTQRTGRDQSQAENACNGVDPTVSHKSSFT
jgi:hypothetical protein